MGVRERWASTVGCLCLSGQCHGRPAHPVGAEVVQQLRAGLDFYRPGCFWSDLVRRPSDSDEAVIPTGVTALALSTFEG